MKYILTTAIFLVSFSVQAKNVNFRTCEFTGENARCGDAKEVVYCEGYDQKYYMLDSQKITDLSLAVYKGPPSINRKLINSSVIIKNPNASGRDYSLVLAWHGEALAAGKPVASNENYRVAVEDISSAIRKHGLPKGFVVGTDDFTLGTFKLDKNSDLYRSCDSSEGAAPRPR